MDFVTTNCKLCKEEFTYEPARPRAVVPGRRNFRQLTKRTTCDPCKKNDKRHKRTVEAGYISMDETRREKEIREAKANIQFYVMHGLVIADPQPWSPGPGIEDPLEFGYDSSDFGEVA